MKKQQAPRFPENLKKPKIKTIPNPMNPSDPLDPTNPLDPRRPKNPINIDILNGKPRTPIFIPIGSKAELFFSNSSIKWNDEEKVVDFVIHNGGDEKTTSFKVKVYYTTLYNNDLKLLKTINFEVLKPKESLSYKIDFIEDHIVKDLLKRIKKIHIEVTEVRDAGFYVQNGSVDTSRGTDVLLFVLYKTFIKTGDVEGAETNANVFIKLYGSIGDTDFVKLEGKNTFRKGKKDIFTFMNKYIGDIEMIELKHDSSKSGHSWFVESVKVLKDFIYINQWVHSGTKNIKPAILRIIKDRVDNKIRVHHGGTSSNVYIRLFGENGKESPFQRLGNKIGHFSSAGHSSYTVYSDQQLGKINKIELRHDNTGNNPDWKINKITINKLDYLIEDKLESYDNTVQPSKVYFFEEKHKKKLTLKSLKCIETESLFRKDSPYILIENDIFRRIINVKDLNNGDTHYFNHSIHEIEHGQVIGVYLYEIDSSTHFDADDFLGLHFVKWEKRPGAYSASFKLDGANYKLIYTIEIMKNKNMYLIQSQPKIITDFRKRNKRGKWPYINKEIIISQLLKRKNTASIIDQSGTPLCGPASIAYTLAKKDWETYAKACIDLWENGRAIINKYNVNVDNDLKKDHLPEASESGGIASVDWLFLSSIKDQENDFWDMDSDASNIASLTTPDDMKVWTKKILGFSNAKIHMSRTIGEIDALKKAKNSIENGGVAFLFINADMINESDHNAIIPTHWVTLNKIKINKTTVELELYTWGGMAKKRIYSKQEIENNLFGVVTGY